MKTAFMLWLGLVCVGNGLGQVVLPPPFYPYTGPTVAYPDTQVLFELRASGVAGFELLAAPTNADLLVVDSGRAVLISWRTPPRSAVGTTNQFIVKVNAGGGSALSVTGMVSFVVIDVPPIRSIVSSNGFAVLQFDNPLPIQPLVVQWTEILPPTNWTELAVVNSSAPAITQTDTNPPSAQRFYRLIPRFNAWCYGGDCP